MKKTLFLLVSTCYLISNAQTITTVAGNGTQGYAGDGGQATSAELSIPQGIAIDAIGNLYITDGVYSNIRKVDPSGIITTIGGTGINGYSGDGGQATDAELYSPMGIVADAVGNVYFADVANYRIRKINSSGIISTIAGNGFHTGGGGGYSGDGGQATDAELNGAKSIALDNSGNLYIADANNMRIRMVNTSGIITTIAGTGVNNFSGDGGAATLAELSYPTAIILDAIGNIYFADSYNSYIRKINTAGIITTIAGNGIEGYSGDGGQAAAASIQAYGLTIDTANNLYIADAGNNRIRKVNSSRVITTIAGNGTNGYNGDGEQATDAELFGPQSIALSASGDLFIADLENNRIRKVSNVSNASIKQIASTNEQVIIYPNPTNGSFMIETTKRDEQHLQIVDLNGKVVFGSIVNGMNSIEVSFLDAGVYNVNITSNEAIVNKKLVIIK